MEKIINALAKYKLPIKNLIEYIKITSDIKEENINHYFKKNITEFEISGTFASAVDYCYAYLANIQNSKEDFEKLLNTKYAWLLIKMSDSNIQAQNYTQVISNIDLEHIPPTKPIHFAIMKLLFLTNYVNIEKIHLNPKKIEVLLEKVGFSKDFLTKKEMKYDIDRKVRDRYQQTYSSLIECMKDLCGKLNNINDIEAERNLIIRNLQMYFNIFAFPEEKDLNNKICNYLRQSDGSLRKQEKMELLKKILEDIDSDISSALEKPTENKCCILLPILVKLREIYKNIIGGITTEIDLVKPVKHYPFHNIGVTHEIRLSISNKGNSDIIDLMILADVNEEIKKIKAEVEILDVPDILPSNITRTILVTAKTHEVINELPILFVIGWDDYTGKKHEKELKIIIEGQKEKKGLDWNVLKRDNPYPLTWFDDPNRLTARGDIINRLMIGCSNKEIIRIYGEKRVGKTSIVKVFEKNLKDINVYPNYLPVVITWGEVLKNDPGEIGKSISDAVSEAYMRKFQKNLPLEPLKIENFYHQIEPLIAWLRKLSDLCYLERIVIIFDDSEYMPTYEGEVGRNFYNGLKTIGTTGKNVLFLVGSEEFRYKFVKKMSSVINVGDSIEVTYIQDRTLQKELIVRPSNNVLEFDETAIDLIISYTAGNPWFTNKICNKLYNIMVEKQDGYVTAEEVEEAVNSISRKFGDYGHFAHFWEEGIDFEEVKINNNKEKEKMQFFTASVLLAMAKTIRSHKQFIKKKEFLENRFLGYIKENELLDNILNNLVERSVLEKKEESGEILYRIKVGLLHIWLQNVGKEEIFSKYKSERHLSEEDKKDDVKPHEIKEIADRNWRYGSYGKLISTVEINCWIDNFDTARSKRLAYKLLSSIKFYDKAFVRNALKNQFDTIVAKFPEKHYDERRGVLQNVFVTHGDSTGKSGGSMLYLFNQALSGRGSKTGNIEKLRKFINEESLTGTKKAVILVNDFIGTGTSAVKEVKYIYDRISRLEEFKNTTLFYIATVAFQTGKEKIETECKEITKGVYVEEMLFDYNRAFSPDGRIFSNSDEILEARRLCEEKGSKLVGLENALGMENYEALVVFEHAIPNDTLPIFWSNKHIDGKDWIPLFERES